MGHFWIIFLILYKYVSSQNDPCTDHQVLNATKFRTDSNQTDSGCSLFPPFGGPPWYRFTSTPSGEIATRCPQKSTCGAINQIWIKDSLPSVYDGETKVSLCIKTPQDCCAAENHIQMKSCNSFYVYKLPLAPSCSRFCINATGSIPTTVSTTEGTTSVTTTSQSTPVSVTTIETRTISKLTTTGSSTRASSTAAAIFTTIVSTTKRTRVPTSRKATKATETKRSSPTEKIGKPSVGFSTLLNTGTTITVESSTLDREFISPTTGLKGENGTSAERSSDYSSIFVIVGATVGSIVILVSLVSIFSYIYRTKQTKVSRNLRHKRNPVIKERCRDEFIQI